MKENSKRRYHNITGTQAEHLALWVDFSLARLFIARESVQKMSEKKLLNIYSNLKFYLKDRGAL